MAQAETDRPFRPSSHHWRKERIVRRIIADDLARTLTQGTVSRKRVLTVLGGAIAAATAPSLTPQPAKAGGAKKRCRKKGGVYMAKGTCSCASDGCNLTCHGNPDCHCYETVEGRGFCAGVGSTGACNSTSNCQAGEVCAKTCIGLVCVPPCPS
jgi:hypothetical protein